MMNRYKKKVAIGFISALFLIPGTFMSASAQGRVSFEFMPGGAAIVPSTLFIRQDGFADLKFKARYRTESFTLPIYYSYRLGYHFRSKGAVELELNHLKVILDNNPPEVQEFSITHGFNQLWANYAFDFHGLVVRAGAGPVLAHPESLVRGKRLETHHGILNKGYYICGITSQMALQKKFFIGKHFFFTAETKVNAAYARVKIADGFARVPVFAWNGLIGIGGSF